MTWIATYVLSSLLCFFFFSIMAKTHDTISFIVFKIIPVILGVLGVSAFLYLVLK